MERKDCVITRHFIVGSDGSEMSMVSDISLRALLSENFCGFGETKGHLRSKICGLLTPETH